MCLAATAEIAAPSGQRQVKPVLGQRPAAPVGAQQPDQRDRDRGLVQHERVRDLGPGQHDRDQDRRPPLPRRAVQDQEDEQQRGMGPGVIRVAQQQRGVAERRGQHDAGGDEEADQALAAGRPALGQQPAQQDDQRVGQRRGHVHGVAVQPVDPLHEHVLGQLGRVERHVRHGPAAEQEVAVQHVPGLQGLAAALRGGRDRPGLGQVGGVQQDAQHHEGDRADGPAAVAQQPGAAAPRPVRIPRLAQPADLGPQPGELAAQARLGRAGRCFRRGRLSRGLTCVASARP